MKEKRAKVVEIAKKNKTVEEANIQDKKGKFLFLGIGVLLLVVICGMIYFVVQKDSIRENDALRFKKEYEKFNCTPELNCKFLEISVSRDNPIVYSSYEEIFKVIDEGTGVIFFGTPDCDWVRQLVPVMLDASLEVGLGRIYYLDNHEDRNTLVLEDNGEVKLEKEGSEEYFQLLEKIDSVASHYRVYDMDGKRKELEDKRLYFPTLLFVKDGEIVDFHEGTLESQVDIYQHPLTDDEKQQLKEILVDKMLKTITCDGAC